MEITPIITEDFVVLNEDSTFSELIAQLKQFEKRTALVFKNNKYRGLIEKKHLCYLCSNFNAFNFKR